MNNHQQLSSELLENLEISQKDGKTIIYLVAFDSSGFSNTPYVLSNLNVNLPGVQMSQEHIDFVRNINL
jgi:hypothetical protein